MSYHLTASLEDYLEAIAELTAAEGHAHTKEIAKKLNVKMPSVTGALRQLEKQGLIIYNAHYPVELTPVGKSVAEEVVRRHGILKDFFGKILGLSPEKASQTACHLEHVVDSDTIERFVLFSKAIEFRSDARQLQIYLSEAVSHFGDETASQAMVLSDMETGTAARIYKIGRNVKDEKGLPLAVGDNVTVQGVSLDRTSVRIKKDGSEINIPLRVAENIWGIAVE